MPMETVHALLFWLAWSIQSCVKLDSGTSGLMTENQIADAVISNAIPKRMKSCIVIWMPEGLGGVALSERSWRRKNMVSRTNAVVMSPCEVTHDSPPRPMGRRL